MKLLRKRPILAVVALIVVLALIKFFQIRAAIAAGASRQMPPDAVTSYKVAEAEWPRQIAAVGSLAAVHGAVLAAEELGRVDKIRFEPGSTVNAGDVLVELDTAVERAQLASSQALQDVAVTELNRQKALRERGANSQSDLENAQAKQRSASADVERLKAIIRRKTIIAPFAGVTGVRLVNEGEVIQPGTQVVSLQSLDSLFLNIALPQRVLGQLAPGATVNFTVDAFPDNKFTGTVTAIDPHVDEATRNTKVQALVENADHKLRAGMFTDAALVLPGTDKTLTIPSSGVSFAPYGDSVFIIEQMKSPEGEKEFLGVRPQFVKLGRRQGDMVAVISGLKAGDEIVSSGVFKLRPGSPVVVNNAATPSTELNPTPADT